MFKNCICLCHLCVPSRFLSTNSAVFHRRLKGRVEAAGIPGRSTTGRLAVRWCCALQNGERACATPMGWRRAYKQRNIHFYNNERDNRFKHSPPSSPNIHQYALNNREGPVVVQRPLGRTRHCTREALEFRVGFTHARTHTRTHLE